jgi:hypothetical protein
MDTETIFEKWRRDRARVEPAAGFADRVMRSAESLPIPNGSPQRLSRTQGLLRMSVCTAAALAALFRVVELFSLFATSNLEN